MLPYQSSWKDDFDSIKNLIWPAVESIALGIEHVGSTSIPGLAAKPVIDIDIVVKDALRSSLAIEALQTLGYKSRGNLGLEGREAFDHIEGLPRHNLYVCLEGCEPLMNHLMVRNALRSEPNLVKDYSQLKLSLAKQFPDDIESYIDGKTDFLLCVLEQAGFPKEALVRAENLNRKKV